MSNQIILDSNPQILKVKTGNSFPKITIIACWIALFIGVVFTIGAPVVGIPFSLACLFVITSKHGIEFNVERQEYRAYNTYFGIKTGQWITQDEYPQMGILSSTKEGQSLSVSNQSHYIREKSVDLYLLNANHRKKLLIKSFDNYEEALILANTIVEKTSIKLVKYNPPVSARTKMRRRR